jgi:hypothetical protein
MAAIAVNERFVKLARVDQSMTPAVSGEPLDAGNFVTQAADGRYIKGGTNGGGIVVETVLTANAPISVLKKGILDVGDALQTRDPGTPVFGTPAGGLDDAATGNVRVATVEAGRGNLGGGLDGSPASGGQRKYLRVEVI